MTAGRPKQGDAGALYAFPHQFYWDLRRLVEGSYRQRLDQERYSRLLDRAQKVPLRDDQIAHAQKYLEEEVKAGRVKKIDKPTRRSELLESTLETTREELRNRADKLASVQLKIPGEPDVFDALLQV